MVIFTIFSIYLHFPFEKTSFFDRKFHIFNLRKKGYKKQCVELKIVVHIIISGRSLRIEEMDLYYFSPSNFFRIFNV